MARLQLRGYHSLAKLAALQLAGGGEAFGGRVRVQNRVEGQAVEVLGEGEAQSLRAADEIGDAGVRQDDFAASAHDAARVAYRRQQAPHRGARALKGLLPGLQAFLEILHEAHKHTVEEKQSDADFPTVEEEARSEVGHHHRQVQRQVAVKPGGVFRLQIPHLPSRAHRQQEDQHQTKQQLLLLGAASRASCKSNRAQRQVCMAPVPRPVTRSPNVGHVLPDGNEEQRCEVDPTVPT
mmetsp:Transcript_83937/g.242457  ORF Transcript_83937/g.242457 Transcript_83937/m.242457 type:complete len:237 (-) Transcript_83937:184-894(-)